MLAMVVLFLWLACLPIVASATTTHTVMKGECLSSVAVSYHIAWKTLCAPETNAFLHTPERVVQAHRKGYQNPCDYLKPGDQVQIHESIWVSAVPEDTPKNVAEIARPLLSISGEESRIIQFQKRNLELLGQKLELEDEIAKHKDDLEKIQNEFKELRDELERTKKALSIALMEKGNLEKKPGKDISYSPLQNEEGEKNSTKPALAENGQNAFVVKEKLKKVSANQTPKPEIKLSFSQRLTATSLRRTMSVGATFLLCCILILVYTRTSKSLSDKKWESRRRVIEEQVRKNKE